MTWTTRPRSEHAGLAVVRAGTGRPILLLHGVGLRAEAWGAQLDALTSHYQLTAPDMPGHGLSPLDAGLETLSDYADRMGHVLQSLNSPAVIVGHSMGAMIAVELATRFPQLVEGLVALNAVFERSSEASSAVCSRASALDGETPTDPSPTLERWFGTDQPPQRAACHTWLSEVSPMGYKLAYTAFAQSQKPSRSDLSGIRCPAVFMTGQLEPNSTPAMAETMAEICPGGRAQIVAGAAHMMPMTHPGDVNTALFQFLKEVWQ